MISKQHYIDKTQDLLLAEVCYYNQLDAIQMDQLLNPIELKPSAHPLFLLAKERILKAIMAQEKIIVCGDYDADGVCSTAILVKTLRDLGANVGYYVPHRFEEGYGLNLSTVEQAIKKGYSLFITVDNGVSAYDALKRLKHEKIDVIVIDHHEITEAVDCLILIHPDLLEEDYKFSCGSALAYMLSTHLKPNFYLCALAAVASIADVMDLWGYNRTLIKQGLKYLNENEVLNLKALADKHGPLDELSVAFQIVPKINAIGRMNEDITVNALVEYFCTEDPTQILFKAQQIKTINDKRKNVNSMMMTKTSSALSDPHAVVIIDDPEFHEGIVGITAGQLSRKTRKPVIVLAHKDHRYKGSLRAPLGIDLRELLRESLPFTLRYGGHALAAGIEIAEDQYEAFKQSVYASTDALNFNLTERLNLHFEPELFSIERYTHLMSYRPFGQGFELPDVELEDARVLSAMSLKNGFKWQVDIQGQVLDVLCFNQCEASQFDQKYLHCIGRLSLNTFRSKTSFTLVVESWT